MQLDIGVSPDNLEECPRRDAVERNRQRAGAGRERSGGESPASQGPRAVGFVAKVCQEPAPTTIVNPGNMVAAMPRQESRLTGNMALGNLKFPVEEW